jgi:thiol-disulfide isomerase/thioredoxin
MVSPGSVSPGVKREHGIGWALIVVGVVAVAVVVGTVAIRSLGDASVLGGGSGDADFSTGLTRILPGERGDPITLAGDTLEGAPLDIVDWRGEVVVVNLSGSWCGPCHKEAPDLTRAYEETRSKGVHFVGIDVRDNIPAAEAFTEEYGIEYPSLFDTDGSLLLSFNGSVPVSAIPSTVVLDQQGRIAATVIGVIDPTTLLGLVTDVLHEAPWGRR